MRELPNVNSGWIERFPRMHEIMQEGVIYMDTMRRKRAATSPKETVLEIRLSDKPYPEFVKGTSEDDYRREVYEWMGSSIELCLIEADTAWDIKVVELWEPCAFACMLTVQGFEVMVGTKHRLGPNADLSMFGDLTEGKSLRYPNEIKSEQVYIEFSMMLNRSKVRHEPGTAKRPPIREKTFRESHEDFIKQMDLDF